MGKGMAWWAKYGIWYGLARHSMVYGMAGMAWYMIWLVGMAWHMVWPGGHNMVYGMVWRGIAWYMAWPGNAWLGLWYGLVEMAWYIWHSLSCIACYTVWHCGHGMVYGKPWAGLTYGIWPGGHGMLHGMVWRA